MIEAPWGFKETSTPHVLFLTARGDRGSNGFNLWKRRSDLSYRDVGAFDSFAQRGHVVAFDGCSLLFPHCKDAHGLEQARRNAEWLGSSLTKATGEPVQVEAALTLPGWFVERRGKGAVRVLNHKELRSGLIGQGRLTSDQVQRIVHQLDQRCRDVEF